MKKFFCLILFVALAFLDPTRSYAQTTGNYILILKNGTTLSGDKISLDSLGNITLYFPGGTYYKDKIENVSVLNSSNSSAVNFPKATGDKDPDDSLARKINFSLGLEYQASLGSSNTILGIRPRVNFLNSSVFNFGGGVCYHQSLSDIISTSIYQPSGFTSTEFSSKSTDLKLLGPYLGFRYILKNGKVQRYIEGIIEYDYQLIHILDCTSSSDEISSSWYNSSTSSYVNYKYIAHLHTSATYKDLSSFKIVYGFKTKVNQHLGCFFDFGISNYRGSYDIKQSQDYTLTSGTPPPSGIYYYSNYYIRNGTSNINILSFDFSFGFQF